MAVVVALDLPREPLGEFGAFRPRTDQAHLASEHVDQLR